MADRLLLANAWTIWASEKPVDIDWVSRHGWRSVYVRQAGIPSQSLQELGDGRVDQRLRVASTTEIKHWVLG